LNLAACSQFLHHLTDQPFGDIEKLEGEFLEECNSSTIRRSKRWVRQLFFSKNCGKVY
jgi:hypothetical protein